MLRFALIVMLSGSGCALIDGVMGTSGSSAVGGFYQDAVHVGSMVGVERATVYDFDGDGTLNVIGANNSGNLFVFASPVSEPGDILEQLNIGNSRMPLDLAAGDFFGAGAAPVLAFLSTSQIDLVARGGVATAACPVMNAVALAAGNVQTDTPGLDLVLISKNPNQVVLYGNSASDTFCSNVTTVQIPNEPKAVVVFDYNNDDVDDIVVAAPGQPLLLIRGGTDGISNSEVFSEVTGQDQVYGMGIGDFDADSHIDVVATVATQGPNYTSFFFNRGINSPPASQEAMLAMGTVASGVVGVRTKNGTIEHSVVIGQSPGSEEGIVFLEAIGNKQFNTTSSSANWRGQPRHLVTADLNGEGADDVIGPVNTTNDIAVMLSR